MHYQHVYLATTELRSPPPRSRVVCMYAEPRGFNHARTALYSQIAAGVILASLKRVERLMSVLKRVFQRIDNLLES